MKPKLVLVLKGLISLLSFKLFSCCIGFVLPDLAVWPTMDKNPGLLGLEGQAPWCHRRLDSVPYCTDAGGLFLCFSLGFLKGRIASL